jgi:hypothetical protein
VPDRRLVEEVAAALGTRPNLVEKDWHVVRGIDGHLQQGVAPDETGTSFSTQAKAVIIYRSLTVNAQGRPMTKLLDQALEAARSHPPDAQDDIAHVVLRLAGADDEPPVPLTPEEQAAIAASKSAAARGEFATDEQVRAVWAKHGL